MKLNQAKALELLAEIVKEYGNSHVYQAPGYRAVYVFRDKPSCLIGHVLYRAGVPINRIALLDGPDAFGCIRAERLDTALWLKPYVEFTQRALFILDTAQSMQDAGDSWGDVLSRVNKLAVDDGGILRNISSEGEE